MTDVAGAKKASTDTGIKIKALVRRSNPLTTHPKKKCTTNGYT